VPDNQGDHHADPKGRGDTDADNPAEGGGLGKSAIAASADCRGLSPIYALEDAWPNLLSL